MVKGKCILICLILTFTSSVVADEIKERVEKPVNQAISTLKQTQKEEEEWRLLQEKLTIKLDSLQVQVDQLTATRNDLQSEVETTKERLAKKKRQLADIKLIEDGMEPFLRNLIAAMASFPDQGLPFLPGERRERMERLNIIMDDPEIALSEKYRKTMEALQIEAEFGLTIETTQEMIELEGQEVLVNTFRLGRVGFYFVTLDELSCGFYNLAESKWQPLPERYIRSLQTAVAIADKRRPIEFIDMPLGSMVKK